MKPLKEVQTFLNNIPNINLGGCGIAALALYDAALAQGKKAKIIYGYSYWSSGRKENELYRDGLVDKPQSAGHVFIHIDGQDLDSGGVYKRRPDWDFQEGITREHLVKSIRYGSWNDLFHKSAYLPEIEAFVGYKLVRNSNLPKKVMEALKQYA